jgi:hypothetical protein
MKKIVQMKIRQRGGQLLGEKAFTEKWNGCQWRTTGRTTIEARVLTLPTKNSASLPTMTRVAISHYSRTVLVESDPLNDDPLYRSLREDEISPHFIPCSESRNAESCRNVRLRQHLLLHHRQEGLKTDGTRANRVRINVWSH